ncbi:M23 family metallopeptidase [Daejeonella lutea]|uniref:Peptidase family M23 n=1 Tax=Daejeonella lutea TaxID=572036 RepID=A0A1T5ASL4_9SPHI|nr:M23 family metallopeptidase [Daejeonella lutea]SKB37810.1 Peptidase family M23 [Daejeonella lutea]
MIYHNIKKPILILVVFTAIFLFSCKSGPFNVLNSASPHERYKRSLSNSGIDKTTMGKTWMELSERVLDSPLNIKVPYLEKGYFPSEKVQAAAFAFNMQRGQKLHVKLTRKPVTGFMIFTDIWEKGDGVDRKLLGSTDTLGNVFQSEIERTGTYILRIQPELLAGGEYTLEITAGPSLAYPLKSYERNQIRSFWGDGRDDDSRKHEGVDIFASFRTPVIAVAEGTTRVNENNLGGKVVWLRPTGKDFTLYYAHLDEQSVSDGQSVRIGDTIGKMGNTGNAKTTPPHLHFGIYTGGGAVDPLPFINPVIDDAPQITSQLDNLNSLSRIAGNTALRGGQSSATLKSGTILRVVSASGSNYRIELPDGTSGFVASNKVGVISGSLRTLMLNAAQVDLFDKPDSSAAVKLSLRPGDNVKVLGTFGEFDFVSAGGTQGWIRR